MKKLLLLIAPLFLVAQSVEFKSCCGKFIDYRDYKLEKQYISVDKKSDFEYYALGETIGNWKVELTQYYAQKEKMMQKEEF